MIGRHRAVTEEESAKILRLHHAEVWPVGTIAIELGRHHDTIERVLAQSGLPVTKQSPRPRLVDAYLPYIAATGAMTDNVGVRRGGDDDARRAASCELRATSCELRAASCEHIFGRFWMRRPSRNW